MTTLRAVALSTGACLPEKILTNDDLARIVDTSDDWITARTGIKQRHVAAEGQFTSDLAICAAQAALERAGLSGGDIDLIVLATATPDDTFPATAVKVQAAIGMHHGFAFDVQAVCSGFLYALTTANQYLINGQAGRALVIGAETFSRILDWSDRATCVLFGDGAGAVVLEAQEMSGTNDDRGFLFGALRSDGRFRELLYVDGGPSTTQNAGFLRMRGREVFRHAVENLAAIADNVIEGAGFQSEDIDWVVPHQANYRIIEATARRTGVDMDKVILTVQKHGNTSAASIPLALNEGVEKGLINQGDLLLFEAMGGGLTWGAALMRW